MSLATKILSRGKRTLWMFTSWNRTLFFVQRALESKAWRDRGIALVRRFKSQPRSELAGTSSITVNREPSEILSELCCEGHSVLGKLLDPQTVESIKSSIMDLPACDYLVDKTKYCSLDELPESKKSAMYRREDLVKIPEILAIGNDQVLLGIVQEYLGALPLLSNILCWWSFPSGSAVGPQNFHRDVDDFKFVKLFIYLTDCDATTGPHVYVRGSHEDPDSRMRELRRYADDEIADHYGQDALVKLTGETGTAFLSDSYGFHKGIPPESDVRLLLQFQWSLLPIGIEQYKPVRYQPPFDIERDINRLLLSS